MISPSPIEAREKSTYASVTHSIGDEDYSIALIAAHCSILTEVLKIEDRVQWYRKNKSDSITWVHRLVNTCVAISMIAISPVTDP